MDFTIMIIVKSSEAMTSQLKTFPSKGFAERALEAIERQATKSTNRIEVLRLYDKDAL